MGDPAGIGGELIAKAIEKLAHRSIPVVIGDASVLYQSCKTIGLGRIGMKRLGEATLGEAGLVDPGILTEVEFGASDATCGEASYRYLMEALKLIFSGVVDAVVTCPITKKSIQAAGIPFRGHTELLAHYAGVTDYVMMMKNRSARSLSSPYTSP